MPNRLLLFLALALGMASQAQAAIATLDSCTLADTWNPKPLADDVVLPMPGGLSMAFRIVAVPSEDLLSDEGLWPGTPSPKPGRLLYDAPRREWLSAPLRAEDLPAGYALPRPRTGRSYYLVAKYEVSRLQWRVVMEGPEAASSPLTAVDARPVVDVSWYEAVDFTARYTRWLLSHHPESLPRFAASDRDTAFLRLPTELEWEYAARGGQASAAEDPCGADFFRMEPGTVLSDYAVYLEEGTSHHAARPMRIGSRRPNPLGIHDTAGNVAEMTADLFRFSIRRRAHGSAGGFVRKGGSFRSGKDEVMPGRREEAAFFLMDGPGHASDLGFRPVLSGINTAGPARQEALLAEETAALSRRDAAPPDAVSGSDLKRRPADAVRGSSSTSSPSARMPSTRMPSADGPSGAAPSGGDPSRDVPSTAARPPLPKPAASPAREREGRAGDPLVLALAGLAAFLAGLGVHRLLRGGRENGEDVPLREAALRRSRDEAEEALGAAKVVNAQLQRELGRLALVERENAELQRRCAASIQDQVALERLQEQVARREKVLEDVLLKAAAQGRADIAADLLGAGADAGARTWEGETALMLAAAGGHGEVARLLLAAGADVDAASWDGRTALMGAAQEGRGELVRLLVAAGADVLAEDEAGRTAAAMAAEGGHGGIAAWLAGGASSPDSSPS